MKKLLDVINLENACMFLAISFSSMLGYSIAGISINKIALLPLLGLVLIKSTSVFRLKKIALNKLQIAMVLIYGSSVFSVVYNYCKQYTYIDYYSKLTNWVVQLFVFYIPIMILIKYVYGEELMDIFLNCLVWVCRIQSFWAIIQFVYYYVVGTDINNYLFNELLNGLIKGSNSAFLYDNARLALRVTGFNYDPAFLGILLVLGFCIDKKLFRYLYFFVACLAMSRTALVTICVIYLYESVFCHKKKIKFKSLFGQMLIVLIGVSVVVILYFKNQYVSYQIDYLISRMGAIFNNGSRDQGTDRHMLYIPYALYSWFFELNIVEKLLGVGPRVSGLAFTTSNYISSKITLTTNMLTTAWGIECDFADVLLGFGIVGMLLYYYIGSKIIKYGNSKSRMIVIALLIFGFMYNCFTTTLVQLLLIVFVADYSFRRKIN